MQQPSWMEHAWRELGQSERAGRASNTRIRQMFRDAGHPKIASDEVAWCAAFVGACLARAGCETTRSLMARSYLAWGEPDAEQRPGAIAVFSRGSDPSLGHVGFLVGEAQGKLVVLGGNQENAVSVASIPRTRLLALRWPKPEVATSEPVAGADDLFARALAHVLEMEGGYTNDPADPGGPTNFGITLAVYARWLGRTLDAATATDLTADLRRIDPATVRDIYRERYWNLAHCPTLPPALALMHFDAAVNQGPGTAVRFLQEAVRTAIDGEIGPATRAAIAEAPVATALARYADIRRRRYRRLPHFTRFGRGWLRRVDRTLERALALDREQPQLIDISTGDETMIEMTETDTGGKWWGQSITIWGTIVTGLSAVLPVIGPLLGLNLTADLVRELGQHAVAAVQAVGALVGTLMTIYGRVRATQPLMRRPFKVRL